MHKKSFRLFLLLIILTSVLVVINLPGGVKIKQKIGPWNIDRELRAPEININTPNFKFQKTFDIKYGLDISGGTQVTLEADMTGIEQSKRAEALQSSKEIIDRRVNFFGVSEPVVQTAVSGNSYRINVELPGVTNVDTAIQTIGQTAKLEFREFTDESIATQAANPFELLQATKPVGLDGTDLKRAMLSYSQTTGEPEVALEFTPEGAKKFADITERLTGKQLPVFLDFYILMAPTVSGRISGGQAVITGGFTQEQAKILALQLSAGALPVPIHVVGKQVVGASLGQAAIDMSIKAGIVGLGIVAIFMIAQYGWLGAISLLGLVLYGLISFAFIRIIPITLTLPGMAGMILSIGMAVDSNILIFERFKEEVRRGTNKTIAIETAFGKAWDSIRDANITTILTSLILYNPLNWQFLPSSGLVRGFAATLLLGVVTSLFTGIVVTRTFIRVLYKRWLKD